jgi:hypothetical protein
MPSSAAGFVVAASPRRRSFLPRRIAIAFLKYVSFRSPSRRDIGSEIESGVRSFRRTPRPTVTVADIP